MATAAQISALADKALAHASTAPAPLPPAPPAPAPAPLALSAPTNASLPRLGPVTLPIAHAFVPPPLSPAQRAAITRAQRAAGILPAKLDKAAPAPTTTARPAGLDLVLQIGPMGKAPTVGGMIVSFGFFSAPNVSADIETIPPDEIALPFLSAICPVGAAGELDPSIGMAFNCPDATASQLGSALPLMRKLNGALLNAYTETEDASFSQTVLALAVAMRATRIEVSQPDGSILEAKRGAAYITAFKAWEAHKPR